jgi:hypothetical protein
MIYTEAVTFGFVKYLAYAHCKFQKEKVRKLKIKNLPFGDIFGSNIFFPLDNSFSRLILRPANLINSSLELGPTNLNLLLCSRYLWWLPFIHRN